MFVEVQEHGKGIGRMLINHVEAYARTLKISKLMVNSSVTARDFYIKCGYSVIRKTNKPLDGMENTVFEMAKDIL